MVCQSIDEAKFRNRAQRNYGGRCCNILDGVLLKSYCRCPGISLQHLLCCRPVNVRFVVFVAYVFAGECLIGFLLNLTDKD